MLAELPFERLQSIAIGEMHRKEKDKTYHKECHAFALFHHLVDDFSEELNHMRLSLLQVVHGDAIPPHSRSC